MDLEDRPEQPVPLNALRCGQKRCEHRRVTATIHECNTCKRPTCGKCVWAHERGTWEPDYVCGAGGATNAATYRDAIKAPRRQPSSAFRLFFFRWLVLSGGFDSPPPLGRQRQGSQVGGGDEQD